MFYIYFVLLVFGAVCSGVSDEDKSSNDGSIKQRSKITKSDYPYQAYLRITHVDGGGEYFQCGGSIISPDFILSTAHCFKKASTVLAEIGSVDGSGGTIYRSAYTLTHDRFDPNSKDYDIGLMKTETKMQLDGVTTQAVTLIEGGKKIPKGTKIKVSGWGQVSPKGPVSSTLLAVELETISNEECNQILGGIHERQLCAGYNDGSKGICKGDSGGPAVLSENEVQVGIISAGYGCGKPYTPGIYVNVTSLRGWIRTQTGV